MTGSTKAQSTPAEPAATPARPATTPTGPVTTPVGRSATPTEPVTTLSGLVATLMDNPRRPRLVWYTPDGARTELSDGSLANWTAKVSGLLRDEIGLGPTDVAAVLARRSWQLGPVLLGCWWAGLTVTVESVPSTAAVAFVDGGADDGTEESAKDSVDLDAGADADADADDVFVLSTHPLGAPVADLVGVQQDLTTAALPQSDRLGRAANGQSDWVAAMLGGRRVTASELVYSASEAADRIGRVHDTAIRPVVLTAGGLVGPDDVAGDLLAVLAADGALVCCPAGLTTDRLAALARSERVTATVGVDIPGIARCG